MSFYVIQELLEGRWVQADLTHYTLEQAQRSVDIYRLCLPHGNAMRLMKLQVVDILPSDGEQ